MNRFLVSSFVFLMFLLSGCLDEIRPKEQEYPITKLLPPKAISQDGVILTAEVFSTGTLPIIEHGFEWANNEADFYLSPNRLVLPIEGELKAGVFETELTRDLLPGENYIVRHYVRTDKYTIYSNEERFISEGSKWNPWESAAPFPGKNNGSNAKIVNFTISNNLFIYLSSPGTFWKYDADINVWSPINTSINFQYYDYLFSINGKAYFFQNLYPIGYTLWQYDTAQNAMIQIGSELSFDPRPVFSFSFESLKKSYVFGYQLAAEYNFATDEWNRFKKPPPFDLNGSYGNYYSYTIGNIGYVIAPDSTNSFTALYAYDPINDTWSKKANLINSFSQQLIVFGFDADRIFIGEPDASTKSTYRFTEKNLSTGKQSFIGRAPFRSPSIAVNILANKVFISSGEFEITYFISFDPSKLIDIQ